MWPCPAIYSFAREERPAAALGFAPDGDLRLLFEDGRVVTVDRDRVRLVPSAEHVLTRTLDEAAELLEPDAA